MSEHMIAELRKASELSGQASKLRTMADAIVNGFKDELASLALRYATAASDGYQYDRFPGGGNTSFDLSVDGSNNIVCVWSETWAYGGNDSGEFSFPFDIDIDAFEARRAVEKADKKERDAKRAREVEIAQLRARLAAIEPADTGELPAAAKDGE